MIKPISKGNFASVYEGFDLKQNINVAIKVFNKAEISPQRLQMIHREYSIMSKINSPFIVEFYEFIDTKEYSFLIMECCKRSLGDYLRDCITLSEEETLDYIKQIMLGLEVLHLQHRVVHRE